ncbi:hypothetical protein AB4K20DRAFT_1966485 [Rhizopus microsporus]
MTNISDKYLTKACQMLISKLINCSPSTREIRYILRCHPLDTEVSFDFIVRSNLSFMEVLQLERNTAFLTTIPILHNLFLDSYALTGDVKRNGVAFMVINSKVTPLFVELSGRIRFNNGAERARSDKEKLLCFESLAYLRDCFINRVHFELPCPTASKELKQFVYKLLQLFGYREALEPLKYYFTPSGGT